MNEIYNELDPIISNLPMLLFLIGLIRKNVWMVRAMLVFMIFMSFLEPWRMSLVEFWSPMMKITSFMSAIALGGLFLVLLFKYGKEEYVSPKRISRKEFWLKHIAISAVFVIFVWRANDAVTSFFYELNFGAISALHPAEMMKYSLAVFAYTIVDAKLLLARYHDTGHSGWWIVPIVCYNLIVPMCYICPTLAFVFAIVGLILNIPASIVMLVFTLKKGDSGENKYGPSPLR